MLEALCTCVLLSGPVGSGRGEVSPTHSCSSSWLSPHRAVLHTSGGHVYQTPTVQLVKITLHRAEGLQNLHVDPQAAAAAAAAISKMGVVAEAASRTERARLAAANAVLGELVVASCSQSTAAADLTAQQASAVPKLLPSVCQQAARL